MGMKVLFWLRKEVFYKVKDGPIHPDIGIHRVIVVDNQSEKTEIRVSKEMDSFIDIVNNHLLKTEEYSFKFISNVARFEYQGGCWGNNSLYIIIGLDTSIDRHLVELIIKKNGVNITKKLLRRYDLTSSCYWLKNNNDIEWNKACDTLVGLLLHILKEIDLDDSLELDSLVESARENHESWMNQELKQADYLWLNGDRIRARTIYEKWEGILNKLQQKRLFIMRNSDKNLE